MIINNSLIKPTIKHKNKRYIPFYKEKYIASKSPTELDGIETDYNFNPIDCYEYMERREYNRKMEGVDILPSLD